MPNLISILAYINTYIKGIIHVCVNYSLYTEHPRALIFPPMSELSTNEVAERMNVSVHTVRWWCRNGLLPNAREVSESRGSVWKIPASDLVDFTPPKKTGRPPNAKASPAKANGATKKPATKKGGKK